MAVDRRLLLNIDWVLLGAVLLLAGIGVATIVSATQRDAPRGPLPQAALCDRPGPGGAAGARARGRLPAAGRPRAALLRRRPSACSPTCCCSGPRIAGTQRWFCSGASRSSPPSSPSWWPRCSWPRSSRESQKESLGLLDVVVPGAAIGLLALLIAAEPDLGTRLLPRAALPDRRVPGRAAHARHPRAAGGAGARGRPGLAFALKDYQKSRIYSFLDPSLDPQGRRLPEDPVGDRGGLGRPAGQGLQARAARASSATCRRATPTSSSPCWPRRLGFLGVVVVLGLYLFVLWRALRDGAARARPRGRVPGRGHGGRARVPGCVQCRHGRGPGPRQGPAAAAHELRRLLRRSPRCSPWASSSMSACAASPTSRRRALAVMRDACRAASRTGQRYADRRLSPRRPGAAMRPAFVHAPAAARSGPGDLP